MFTGPTWITFTHTGTRSRASDRDLKKSFAALDRIAHQEATLGKLDETTLNACMAKQDETQIRASAKLAEDLGIDGTPAVYVNGERVNGGAVPQNELWMAIDRAVRGRRRATPGYRRRRRRRRRPELTDNAFGDYPRATGGIYPSRPGGLVNPMGEINLQVASSFGRRTNFAAAALVSVAIFSALSGCHRSPSADVVATVNGKEILRAELERNYQISLGDSPQTPSSEEADIRRMSVLHQMIRDEILQQQAAKLNLTASDEDVNA